MRGGRWPVVIPDARGAVGLGWEVEGAGEGRWRIQVPVRGRLAQGGARAAGARAAASGALAAGWWRGARQSAVGMAGERAA